MHLHKACWSGDQVVERVDNHHYGLDDSAHHGVDSALMNLQSQTTQSESNIQVQQRHSKRDKIRVRFPVVLDFHLASTRTIHNNIRTVLNNAWKFESIARLISVHRHIWGERPHIPQRIYIQGGTAHPPSLGSRNAECWLYRAQNACPHGSGSFD